MSGFEDIQSQVGRLSLDELREFRAWFADLDAEAWDRQIEADAKSGKLREAAQRLAALGGTQPNLTSGRRQREGSTQSDA